MHLLCLIFTHPKGWRWEELQYEQVWSLGCLWLPGHHCKLSLMITTVDLATISFSKTINIFPWVLHRWRKSSTSILSSRWFLTSEDLSAFLLVSLSTVYGIFFQPFFIWKIWAKNSELVCDIGSYICWWIQRDFTLHRLSAKLLQLNSLSWTQIYQTIHREGGIKCTCFRRFTNALITWQRTYLY